VRSTSRAFLGADKIHVSRMKTLSDSDAKAWCEQRGYRFDQRGLPVLRTVGELEGFSIPQDAGARVHMAKWHMESFRSESDVCVWLYDLDVWPSGQWEPLFERFRLSYGITESLGERRAHLISNADFNAAISVAVYATLMLWDCHVFGSSGVPFLFYSHDESGKRTANQSTDPTLASGTPAAGQPARHP
jgi:hypothetical protein